MAITYKTNSYVTLDEANAYFANRSNSQAWLTLDNNAKEDLLVTATLYLDDTTEYVGVAVSTSQPLAWPRTGSFYDPKYGATVELDGFNIPTRLKKATYEMALHLAKNPDVMDAAQGVEDLKVGSIALTFANSRVTKTPSIVRSSLGPLRSGSSSGSGNIPWRSW